MPQLDEADITKRFTHHVPVARQQNDHGAIREAYLVFAKTLAEWLPDGREKSLAFTALEESSFWAHAAVARMTLFCAECGAIESTRGCTNADCPRWEGPDR